MNGEPPRRFPRRPAVLLWTIIESAPVAIYTLDPGGHVRSWNASAERMFGWRAEEVLGQPLPIVPEERHEEFLAILARLRRGEMLTHAELRRQRKDGAPIDIALSTAPRRDASGQIAGVVSIAVDLTERKRIEEKLGRRREAAFQIEKLAEMGLLLAAVAHGLNNPPELPGAGAPGAAGAPRGRPQPHRAGGGRAAGLPVAGR